MSPDNLKKIPMLHGHGYKYQIQYNMDMQIRKIYKNHKYKFIVGSSN